MYADPNRSHAVSFVGVALLRGAFVSAKVIRSGGVLHVVAAREFHSLHKAFANFREPLRRLVGESTSSALGVVSKTSHARGYAANPAVKPTCLRPAAYLQHSASKTPSSTRS